MITEKEEFDHEKGLWQYTMREFLKAQRQGLESTIKEMLTMAVSEVKSEPPELEDTIGMEDARKITGLKEKSIYSKVCRVEIPTITRGRPLMFSRAERQLWMKIGRPTVAEMELKRRKGEL